MNCVCTVKSHSNLGGWVYHLLLFFNVQPANNNGCVTLPKCLETHELDFEVKVKFIKAYKLPYSNKSDVYETIKIIRRADKCT